MTSDGYSSEWLKTWINPKIREWLDAMERGDFADAAGIAVAACREHCSRSLEAASATLKQYHFGVRVLLNGLRDVANVNLILGYDGWIESPSAIETAWDLAHDARDRLTGHSGLAPEFLSYCLDQLSPVFESISERFGPGLYTSWETLWDFMACSICKSDIRSCEHVPGEWYGEHECKLHPEGPHPQAVALVTNPRDPRCRIWPWLKKREENGNIVVEQVPIFRIFNPEGNDDGGAVLDTADLFGIQHIPAIKAIATVSLAPDSLPNEMTEERFK